MKRLVVIDATVWLVNWGGLSGNQTCLHECSVRIEFTCSHRTAVDIIFSSHIYRRNGGGENIPPRMYLFVVVSLKCESATDLPAPERNKTGASATTVGRVTSFNACTRCTTVTTKSRGVPLNSSAAAIRESLVHLYAYPFFDRSKAFSRASLAHPTHEATEQRTKERDKRLTVI